MTTDRVEALLTDPDCTGDLLLVGIACVRALAAKQTTDWDLMLEPVYGEHGWKYAVRAIRDDIRRYQHPMPTGRCTRPMIRRPGPCGAQSSSRYTTCDLQTGELIWLESCGTHSTEIRTEWQDWRAHHPPDSWPTPVANAGGVLARHLPEIDWPRLWLQLDPSWVTPPEADPIPPRPVLRVIHSPRETA